MEIQYIGEHLGAGKLGHAALLAAFLLAVISAVVYALSQRPGSPVSLRKWGRISFYGHFLFVLLSIFMLGWMIFHHYFEYQYVWEYTSRDLSPYYLFSTLWAGQEGSFLIWIFCQALMGLFLLRTAHDWERSTMFVVSLAQAFLMLMVLGLSFGSIHIGLNPFALIRELPENAGHEFFRDPNYLQSIADGNGLNPLLENIWMVIHPPILFLGYAAALIPFAFAFAGFSRGDYYGWRKPALPWLNLTGLILGAGIILGGAWAYVSLTFGGFWAWDPVENASLVPWLATVAALHTLLISGKRPQHITWAFVFTILAYALVIYASYLTRSGVLKDASVHSFGDESRTVPLLVFNLVFLFLPLLMLFIRRPKQETMAPDSMLSREFWMFIGAIVIILSAFQVIVTTSIPVINAILGTEHAPPADSVGYYNAWQMPFALLTALLIGFVHYLCRGSSGSRQLWRSAAAPLAVAAAAVILFLFLFPFNKIAHYFFLFFLIFGIYSSGQALIIRIITKKSAGAWTAHLGILLFLLGVLITFSRPNVITKNTGVMTGTNSNMAENQVIFKDTLTPMGPYFVNYTGFSEKGKYLNYKVDFFTKDSKGALDLEFTMRPRILRNSRMGNVFEPDTRHFLSRDIYGYITFANELSPNYVPGYAELEEFPARRHDTLSFRGMQLVLDSMNMSHQGPGGEAVVLSGYVKVLYDGREDTLRPQMVMMQGQTGNLDANLSGRDMRLRFGMSNDQKPFLRLYEKSREYIVLKVMVFPYILIMWAGTIITFIGFALAMRKRIMRRNREE